MTAEVKPVEPVRPMSWARLWSLAGFRLWWLLELFALTGLVVAQPLLDVVGRSPDFFVFREADSRDIVLLAVAITLVPPLMLWGLELLAGLFGRRAQQAVHLVLVAGLLGLLAVEVAKKAVPLRGFAVSVVGVLVAFAGGLLYARGPAVRLWLRFASPAPALFLALFLFISPTSQLLKPPASAPLPSVPGATVGGRPGPIVIVLLDEFPLVSLLDHQGRIDRRLYPNFARLAAQSVWYRNATGVAGMTGWAVPPILTGRYPTKDLLPISSRFPNNLFTLLGGSYHYKMRVFEGMTGLCPPAICRNAKQAGRQGTTSKGQDPVDQGGFRRVARDSAHVWSQIASPNEPTEDPFATLEEATVDADETGEMDDSTDPSVRRRLVQSYKRPVSLQRFLSAIGSEDPDEPALYFVHVLVPHQPWKYLPSGLKYPERVPGEGKAKGGHWASEPWPVRSNHQRHLMQVGHTDRLIGTVIKRLRETGLYDPSLLVVTADHGMAFTPGESSRANVTDATAPDAMWVPLFIKHPGQRDPSITDVNWEHVDLVPTIADIMGFQVPWPVDGVSWADPSAASRLRTDKWFFPRPGLRRTVDGSAGQTEVLRGVTDRLLRPQDGYMGWFAFGPHADLVGRRVEDLAITGPGGTAQIHGLGEYDRVDPASGWVPAQVSGQLTSQVPGVPARPVVAVAVNGVIGGVSDTFASGRSPPTRFSAMISDSLLRPGGNRLQLFLVDPAGGEQRLRPLTLIP
jgi:arylsulfatase A-like enzyme